jgi:hypothetical protein
MDLWNNNPAARVGHVLKKTNLQANTLGMDSIDACNTHTSKLIRRVLTFCQGETVKEPSKAPSYLEGCGGHPYVD